MKRLEGILGKWLRRRPIWTFILMGLFFLLFGVFSLNLFVIFHANIKLFIEYGVMALSDGVLVQFFQLLGFGYLSMFCYVMFKACEHLFVAYLTQGGVAHPEPVKTQDQ